MTNNFTAEEDGHYSQGVCEDGAAILRDGERMTVDEVVAELNAFATLLEQSEAGVTADPITHKCEPISSESQPADSGRVTDAMVDAGHDAYLRTTSKPIKVAMQEIIRAALAAQGQGEANDRRERELGQLIDERDRREEIIDCLCDAVLGQGRPEWSSAYGYDDALLEVQEAMFAPPRAQPVLTQDQIVRHQIAASDCPPDSKVLLVSSVQRLLSAASPAGVPNGWRETILSVLSALDVATGDSDPNIDADLTDDEIRDEYPEVWAMQQLSAMLAAAPSQPEDAQS